MGVLWTARHLALGTRVVVKFLADGLSQNPRAAARLAAEAASTARVRSPHVVQMLDHGVSDAGAPYVVMEHLEGRDLAACLEERPVLDASETLDVVRQVSLALARAHEAGIVHRDVKPSNIFLCDVGAEKPFVKLLDFGIAKSLAANGVTTASGSIVGTPAYMSPEQIVGSSVDARADIWALGVVVFECLVGRRPFEAETIGAMALLIHGTSAPSLRAHAPTLPPPWTSGSRARVPSMSARAFLR